MTKTAATTLPAAPLPFLLWSISAKKGLKRYPTLEAAREDRNKEANRGPSQSGSDLSDLMILWADDEFTPWPSREEATEQEIKQWLL